MRKNIFLTLEDKITGRLLDNGVRLFDEAYDKLLDTITAEAFAQQERT